MTAGVQYGGRVCSASEQFCAGRCCRAVAWWLFAVKSFSDENLTSWCSQQWKLNATLNASPAAVITDTDTDTGGEKLASTSATSLRMRVARAWSSRDLLDRISKVNMRPLHAGDSNA